MLVWTKIPVYIFGNKNTHEYLYSSYIFLRDIYSFLLTVLSNSWWDTLFVTTVWQISFIVVILYYFYLKRNIGYIILLISSAINEWLAIKMYLICDVTAINFVSYVTLWLVIILSYHKCQQHFTYLFLSFLHHYIRLIRLMCLLIFCVTIM